MEAHWLRPVRDPHGRHRVHPIHHDLLGALLLQAIILVVGQLLLSLIPGGSAPKDSPSLRAGVPLNRCITTSVTAGC